MRSSLWYRLRLSHPHLYPSGLPSKCQRALPGSFCSWFAAEMPFLHPASVRSFATGVKPQKFKLPPRYDPYGPRPPPSEKILRIADAIASLPPDELKQIGPCLREKLRAPRVEMLSPEAAAAMPQMGAASGPAKAEEKKPEKTAFDVKLEKFDAAAKIKVIKEVRSFTNLGLKEAKELVEKTPTLLKQGVSKEEANDIIEKIKAAGGVAVME